MDYIKPYLRTQKEVYSNMSARLRDEEFSRWSDSEVYRALNDAMSEWSGRVFVPFVYTITGGLTPNVSTYSLPSYIPTDIMVQRYVSRWWEIDQSLQEDDSEYIWVDIQQWNLEPNGTGGQTLRVEQPNNRFGNVDARVLWWGENGFVPDEIQTLEDDIDADDTSLVISGQPDIADVGFVRIDNEWIQYAGTAQSGDTTTLSGLVRGYKGTAALHSSGVEVLWGIAYPMQSLWSQLMNQLRAHLHEIYMPGSSVEETQAHQWQMRWNKQKADEYWASYAPNHAARIKIGRQAAGGALV